MPSSKTVRKPAKKTSTRRPTRQQPVAVEPMSKQRKLHLPAYKLFRLKRVKHPGRLPSVWRLSGQVARILWGRRWLFLGIALVYGVLNMVFVQGLSAGADVNSLKQQLDLGLSGSVGQLASGLSVLTALLASSGNISSPTAGSYQFTFGLLVSLAVIWAVRQTMAGYHVRLRDAFYRGMYPLVPFVLVFVVVLLELIPALAGGTIFNIIVANGIATSTAEVLPWLGLFLVLFFITAYMLCSSLFALYIATLPDMTPIKALRSARLLVRYRRGQVLRKLIFLPVALVVVASFVMLPLIMLVPPVATWVFFALSMFGLVVVHTYMYVLYKALLA